MFNFEQILLNLVRQLYPTGRAMRVLPNSFKERMHIAFNKQLNRSYNDAINVLDSLLPDNDGFTEEDATTWERRLGILVVEGTSFEDRKLAITRKIQHPGTQKARQHFLYIQSQIQKAGFDVFVHENRFKIGGDWQPKDPEEFFPGAGDVVQHGQFQHGQVQTGFRQYDLIVNSIDPEIDKFFNYSGGGQQFFLAGENLGDFASVPAVRRAEFRQLVLKLKPAQTVGIVFINFI